MSVFSQMNPLTLACIVIYMVAVAIIGVIVGKKKVKTADDFNNAGQGLDWKLIAGSGIATAMGVSIVIGKYDLIHESGLSGITASLFCWSAGL